MKSRDRVFPSIALVLFLLVPLVVARGQLNSFNASSPSDLLFLTTADIMQDHFFNLGIEAEFNDYSHPVYENEFRYGLLANWAFFNRFELGLRMPYQLSWYVTFHQIFREQEFRDRGPDDLKIRGKLKILGHQGRGLRVAVGFEALKTMNPREEGDEISRRWDFGASGVVSVGGQKFGVNLNVLHTFINETIVTTTYGEVGLSNLLHVGLGVRFPIFWKMIMIHELVVEQAFPKFIDPGFIEDEGQLVRHQWLTWNLGGTWELGKHFFLRGAITLSFLEGSFDLARELVQISYSF
ncbi:hypothetical protein ISS37_04855 [candidate division KSB1 bacterium]|nr:hypothetical protein [candidate division KSB1 bacterium]